MSCTEIIDSSDSLIPTVNMFLKKLEREARMHLCPLMRVSLIMKVTSENSPVSSRLSISLCRFAYGTCTPMYSIQMSLNDNSQSLPPNTYSWPLTMLAVWRHLGLGRYSLVCTFSQWLCSMSYTCTSFIQWVPS